MKNKMYQIIGPNLSSKICQLPVKNLATNSSPKGMKMGGGPPAEGAQMTMSDVILFPRCLLIFIFTH